MPCPSVDSKEIILWQIQKSSYSPVSVAVDAEILDCVLLICGLMLPQVPFLISLCKSAVQCCYVIHIILSILVVLLLQKMISELVHFSSLPEHSHVDSAIVAVLSHGVDGAIYGTDSQMVKVGRMIYGSLHILYARFPATFI